MYTYFSQYGKVLEATVMRDSMGKSRCGARPSIGYAAAAVSRPPRMLMRCAHSGFGFVVYSSADAAARCMSGRPHTLDGRPVSRRWR